MAGVLSPSPIFLSVYAGKITIDAGDQPVWPAHVVVADEQLTGTKASALPVAVHARQKTSAGDICYQYVKDYYDRVYVDPVKLELGNLVSSQFRQFTVWNAYFTSQNNSALTSVGSSIGIILTEPFAPPTVFAPLEARTYDLNFETSGPLTIDLIYTWTFPFESPTLALTGNRAIIFSFAPDWSVALVERYEWLTQITEVENGNESRSRLRVHPRRSVEYQVLTNEDEKRVLETYMFNWKSRVFAVPLWQDCTRTTSVTALGGVLVDIDTSINRSFRAGQLALLYNGYNDVEAVEIVAVNATSLDLIRPTVVKEWPSGTRIYPVLTGRMQENASLGQPTADINIGSVKFEFLENAAITAVDGPVAYQDGFVLNRQPNRAEDVEVDWQSKYGLVDFGIVEPLVDERAGFPDQITRFAFAENSRADITAWREWFHSRRGKWSKFYMPSWSRDFKLVADIQALDIAIDVEDLLYRDFYALAVQKRDIAIYTTDGQVYYRRIGASVSQAPGIERLTMDAVLNTAYTVAEVKMISFLHPSRLNQDSVDIAWDTQEIAQLDFSTRVIPQ